MLLITYIWQKIFFLAVNGSVIAAEKKQKSILYDEKTVSKVRIIIKIKKITNKINILVHTNSNKNVLFLKMYLQNYKHIFGTGE